MRIPLPIGTDRQRRKFLTLDGLRGVAALGVVAGHYTDFFGGNPLPGAHIAVDLFFVMSGFVVAYSYEDRLLNGMSLRDFAVIRVIRLAPLYWLGTAIAVVAIALALLSSTQFRLWSWPSLAIASAGAVFMVPAVLAGSNKLFLLNIPAWSLFYELLINFVYARTIRRLSSVMVALIALIGITGLAWCAGGAQSLDGGDNIEDAAQALFRVSFGFSVGVLLARTHRLRMLPQMTIPPVVLYLSTIALMWPGDRLGGNEALYDLTVVAILCPLIVLAAVNNGSPAEVAATWLGRISYPIYITHVPIAMIAAGVARKLLDVELSAAGPLGGIAMMVVAVLVADVLERRYDHPVRRWATTRWSREHRARDVPHETT